MSSRANFSKTGQFFLQLQMVVLACCCLWLAPLSATADEVAKGNVLEGLFTPQQMFPQPGVSLTNVVPAQPPGERDPLMGLFTPQPQYPQPGVTIMNKEPEPIDGTKNSFLHLFTPQNQFPQPGVSLMNLEPVAPHELRRSYEHNPASGGSNAVPTMNVGAGLMSPGVAVQYPNYVPDSATSWHHYGQAVSPGTAVNYPNYTPYSETSSFHTGNLMSPGEAVRYPNATDNRPIAPEANRSLAPNFLENIGQSPDPPKPVQLPKPKAKPGVKAKGTAKSGRAVQDKTSTNRGTAHETASGRSPSDVDQRRTLDKSRLQSDERSYQEPFFEIR